MNIVSVVGPACIISIALERVEETDSVFQNGYLISSNRNANLEEEDSGAFDAVDESPESCSEWPCIKTCEGNQIYHDLVFLSCTLQSGT